MNHLEQRTRKLEQRTEKVQRPVVRIVCEGAAPTPAERARIDLAVEQGSLVLVRTILEGIADAIRRADRERREGAPNPEVFTGGVIAAAIRKARQERAVRIEGVGAMEQRP